MAGLGTPAQEAPQGIEGAPDPSDNGLGQTGRPATDEEEKLLSAFMNQFGTIVYPEPPKINPQVLANLKGEFDPQIMEMFQAADPPLRATPTDNLAATGVILTILTDSKMGYQEKANGEGGREEQGEMPGAEDEPDGPSYSQVLMEASERIALALGDIMVATGIAKITVDNLRGAWLRGIDLYRVASPNLDREALKREFVNMELAARRGKLPGFEGASPDEAPVLPGLPGGQPMPQQQAG